MSSGKINELTILCLTKEHFKSYFILSLFSITIERSFDSLCKVVRTKRIYFVCKKIGTFVWKEKMRGTGRGPDNNWMERKTI